MKPNMSQDFSSKRHFHWTKKVGTEEQEPDEADKNTNHHHPPSPPPSSHPQTLEEPNKKQQQPTKTHHQQQPPSSTSPPQPPLSSGGKKKLSAVAVSRIKTALTALRAKARLHSNPSHEFGLGSRVIGTLFGSRRGHVHFAFQKDPNSPPAFLIELATPISGLVKEMASGLVRIALECDKEKQKSSSSVEEEIKKNPVRLTEERVWRTYCNGKKCGFANRRDCGAKEWRILKAVEPISMGAGVLPGISLNSSGDDGDDENNGGGGDGGGGEVMYMRAKFERVVGSRDSEAFYMMNPDSNGTPELSVYLLRI